MPSKISMNIIIGGWGGGSDKLQGHKTVSLEGSLSFLSSPLTESLLFQILVVIEPLLIDEDYYARVEGREIISNLAKAAGLATMISTMRPDIDNMDEYVRNTTAR